MPEPGAFAWRALHALRIGNPRAEHLIAPAKPQDAASTAQMR